MSARSFALSRGRSGNVLASVELCDILYAETRDAVTICILKYVYKIHDMYDILAYYVGRRQNK